MPVDQADRSTPSPARDWFAEWSGLGLRNPTTREQLIPAGVRRATVDVIRLLGELEPRTPASYELEETVRRLDAAWDASGSLRDVEPRHLRRAPWAFFYPKDRPEEWVGHNHPLVRKWLRWLADCGSASAVVAMLRAFLDAYPVKLPVFDDLRRALPVHLSAIETPRTVRWRARCERFGFLERDGPARLVRLWWDVELTFAQFIEEAGLGGGLQASAFVKHATTRLLEDLEAGLGAGRFSRGELAQAFEWLEHDGKLRFDDLTVAVATALLKPFVESAPQAELKESIQAFLCRTIGDPRVWRQRWHAVPETLRNVLFRWLVGASLEDFFRVLDETALDRHWRHRKAFWTAYLKQEAIDDAWVVLGPEAARIFRRGFKAGAAKLLRGTGVEPNHSVLLMRIKGVTIAEWSHNGSCRMWTRGNKAAPKLYEIEYTRSELTDGCDFRQPHVGAEQGRWQDYVAALIQSETRVRVTSASYMPGRRRSW